MKVYTTSKFSYGTLLVVLAAVLYAWTVHQYVFVPIAIFVLFMPLVAFIQRISFQIDGNHLIQFIGKKPVVQMEISKCQLYKRGLHFYSLVSYDGDILWTANLVNDKSFFLKNIFLDKGEQLESAEHNVTVVIKRFGLVLALIVSFAIMVAPAIQYGQVPKSDSELFKVDGVLASVELKKSLIIKLDGYESYFVISPKSGDLVEYKNQLGNYKHKKISLFISERDKRKKEGAIHVWSITDSSNAIISFEHVVRSWINWKRWGGLLLIGIIMFFYTINLFRKQTLQ